MKKWKKILVAICIILLFTGVLDACHIEGVSGKNKILATTDRYHSIEIDGVTWEYAIFKVNINQNVKYQNTDKENIVSCVKVRLVNTNGQTEITIPDTIEQYPVYRIEKNEGVGIDKIISLRIPITVEWIEAEAFLGWSSLKTVKFLDKGKINSTGKEISEENMYFYHIGDNAFEACSSLEEVPIRQTIFSGEENENIGEGIYKNCTGLKQVDIQSVSETAYIPKYTFENCNLEEGIQVADNIQKLKIGDYAFRNCRLKNLEIPCDCVLGEEVFSENIELQSVKFQGNVQGNGEKIFKNSFSQNVDTNLNFEGEEIVLGRYALGYSLVDTISFLNPTGNVRLEKGCVFKSFVETIVFKNKNVVVKEGGLENCYDKSMKIVFENTDTTSLSDGAFYSFTSSISNKLFTEIKEIKFQSRKVIYKEVSSGLTEQLKNKKIVKGSRIIYGENVEQVEGEMGIYLSSVESVYIENPKTIHNASFTQNHPQVYGYSQHKEISSKFEYIQNSGLILHYEDKEIINTKGMELDKLKVYTDLKDGSQLEIPNGKIIVTNEIPNTKEDGYILQYEEELQDFEGSMSVKVYYQDTWDVFEIPVVPKQEIKIQVEWSKDYGNSLIEGQKIDLEELVKCVKIYYNDGSWEEKDEKVLELESEKVSKGKNKISVYLKNNKEIKDSLECNVKENKIESVVASYCEEEVYLGDRVDIDKIKLKAIYTLEENSEKVLPCQKISKTTFDLEGKNIIRVYYTDEMYSDMEVQVKKAKPVKVEAAYKEGFPCYGVEEEINKNGIEVLVTLENQKVLTKVQLEEEYLVNIISYTKNSITATITYAGIESEEFFIPIEENKILTISPILYKDSVLEGSLVGKDLVSYLRISYENGTSKLVSLDDLEQNQLQVSKGYPAVAGQWNTINLIYKGICCKADVWGEEDSMIALDVQYIGGDIEVGKSVELENCKVYLVKKSGERVRVTEKVTIINPIISKVGENEVYVCYDMFQKSIRVNGVKNNKDFEIPQSSFSLKSNCSKMKVSKKESYTIQTNKTIKITLQTQNIRKIQYQFVIKGKKVNAKKWKNIKNNLITIKNTKEKYGILYVRYILPNGRTKVVHTTGFCVDIIVPKTNVRKNQIYKKGKKLVFSDNCGVKWAKLNGKKVKSGTTVNKIGKHTLVVMDRVGNKIKIPFYIR